MNTFVSAGFGLLFLVLSFAVTFLMYYLWSFPFNSETRKSSAPKPLMRIHRVLGYSYVGVYLLMMTHMVPRMWQYQVELPARTVAHLLLGLLIGALLILKLSILRFFRYFERWMPYIGTSLFLCTVLLIGLSVPSVAHEQALANGAVGGGVYSAENRKRVAELLPMAGFAPGTPLEPLAITASLRAGREVLLNQCVRCHDLKTVLVRPRTPSDWLDTVRRMADKPALFAPISEQDQAKVSAYLIAITPDLQRSTKRVPQQEDGQKAPALQTVEGLEAVPLSGPDEVAARAAFEKVCSQCHASSLVDKSPPKTAAAIQSLIKRMTGNGMRASEQEIKLIKVHLTKKYGGAR